jgi:hypothetical protein
VEKKQNEKISYSDPNGQIKSQKESSQDSDRYLISNYTSKREVPISPKRHAFPVYPELPLEHSFKLTDDIFQEFGFPEYVGQSTCEIDQRPIPEVTEATPNSKLYAAMNKWYPRIMDIILNSLQAPYQPYQKDSRLGYPSFEIREDKASYLLEKFSGYMEGHWKKDAQGGFIINNIRLQPDDNSKSRTYTFINSKGRTYRREYGLEERKKTKSGRIASRTRLVFNYPLPNLFKQVLDTAIHNFLLQHRLFHHIMPDLTNFKTDDTVMAVDVSHFDRTVGTAVRLRAEQIGGNYQAIQESFLELPVLSVDDKFRQRFLIKPSANMVFQLGSGDSCVAPIAKEVLLCIYCEAAEQLFNVKDKDTISTCLSSRIGPVTVWNYGDDNIWFGQKGSLSELMSFMSEYLPIEEEIPTKFLGYKFIPEEGFRLSKRSYFKNWYLNERSPGSNFRKYPDLGWMQRREVYAMQGEPGLPDLFPEENKIIGRHGTSVSQIYDRANLQASYVYTKGATDSRVIIGKGYQLTAEERGRLDPSVTTVYPQDTKPILQYLLRNP